MSNKEKQATTTGIIALLIIIASLYFGIRFLCVNEVLVGVLLLVIAFVILSTTIIGIVIYNKTKNKDTAKNQETKVKATKTTKNEKEFEYIDGKKKDLTLNEINDIEELLEDDDLLS